MKSLIFFLALAFVIIHAVGLRQFAQLDTETAIELRSAAQLNDDLAEIEVDAEFRDATLRGRVDSLEAKQRAEKLVREIIPTGRTRLKNEIQVVQDRASSLIASVADGVVDVYGVVPSPVLRNQLVAAAQSVGKGKKVNDSALQVDSKAESEPWLVEMPEFVKTFLEKSTDGRIEATKLGLKLQGQFETQKDKDFAMRKAHQMLPSARIFDETKVAGPQPASLIVSRTGGKYKIGGTLPSTSAGNSLTSNLVEWDHSARVLLDPAVMDAAWVDGAWEAINGFFGEVQGNASVEIDSEKLVVNGEVLSAGRQIQALKWFSGGPWKKLDILAEGLVVRQPKPFKLEIASKDGAMNVSGTGSQAQSAQIMEILTKTEATVSGKVNPVSGIQQPGWWKSFPELVQRFHSVADDAQLSILNDRITIQGRMKAGESENDFKKQLAAIGGLPSPNISGLEWPALKAPSLALVRNQDGSAVLRGAVATKAEADLIANAISSTTPDLKPKLEVSTTAGLGSPAWIKQFPAWWKTVSELIPDASFDVRDGKVELKGRGAKPESLIQVAGLMKKTFGDQVAYTYVPMDMPTAKEAPSLVLKRGATGIELIGKVASEKQRSAIIAAVRASERGVVIRGAQLKVDESVDDVGWAASFPTWWQELRRKVKDPAFEMDGKSFKLTGEVVSPAANQELAGWANDAFGKNVLDRSKVSIPKSRQPTLSIRDDGKVIVVEGEVQSPQQGKMIVDVIQANNRDAQVRSTLTADPFVTTPSWITGFKGWWPNLVRNVKAPSLSYRNGQLSVEGKASASGLDTQAEKLLVTAFGKDVKEKSFKIVAPMEKTPWLKIEADSKAVVVSGLVPSEADKKAVLDALQKLPGFKSDARVTVDAGVKDAPWSKGVAEYANKLVSLHKEGRIELENDTAVVEAVVPNNDEKSRLEQEFKVALNGAFKMDSKITLAVAQPAQLSLAKTGNDWILRGKVPTAEDKKRVVDAVKNTDPSVKEQITVAEGVTRPKWLSEFPNWWSKYRKEVPEGGFVAEGNNEPSFSGRLANRGSDGNAANLLADVFGGKKMKFDWQMPTLKRPRLSMKRDANGVILDGMVPTVKYKADIEAAVKKTEAKVTNRIAVDPDVDAPGWLEKFGEWWPKLRKDIPDATFTLDGDDNSKIEGVADEATSGRVGSFLSGVFGSGIKLPKLETRMPAPTKSPWLQFKGDKSTIVVSGEIADEQAKRDLLADLGKFKGKVDSSGLRITSSVKSESWTGAAGDYVVELVAAAGPSTLNLRDGKAEVNATLPSQSSRDQMARSLGQVVGNGFRITDGLKVGSTSPGKNSGLILQDLLKGQRIYFPKNSSYYNSTERAKIQRFANEINQLKEDNITVYLIGHADARGRSDYNQWLSDKRANRVSRALSSYGVKASFVQVEAKGERDAAPLRAGESAWSKDRRVDIRVGKTK